VNNTFSLIVKLKLSMPSTTMIDNSNTKVVKVQEGLLVVKGTT